MQHHEQVLVVDDGSSEPVAEGLTDLPVDVVTHPENQGKGAALLTAATWGQEHGFSHMVCLDADGQHAPDDLPHFLAEVSRYPRH